VRRILVPLLLAVALAAPVGPVPPAQAAEKFETTVFAKVPAPAQPAYVFVHTNGRVYAGTYAAVEAGTPSRVFEWDRRGTLLRSWAVPGQRAGAEHGVQVAHQTRSGRLVVLDTTTSTVRTLDIRTGRWRTVATLPGATPNYATWGPGGVLYVTDYTAGRIWRVSRRGRPKVWFTSPALEGAIGFGTTGIVFRKKKRDLLITQQTTLDGGGVTPTQGFLYRLPVRKGGRPGSIETLWTSQPTDLPDGFGIGRSGHIYIANAGLTNQIVELDARGNEVARFPEAPLSGDNGSPIPFDTPCSATFLGTRILVANQSAVQGDASHQAILAVEVGERGRRPFLPRRPFLGG
jgi:sugar lactone lactonase YvrE